MALNVNQESSFSSPRRWLKRSLPILCTVLILLSQAASTQSSVSNKHYDCVCPGIWRPVCSWTAAGTLVYYDNVCQAQCSARVARRGAGTGVGILPNVMCKNIDSYRNASDPLYLSTWLEEMETEAVFYAKVNKLMVEVLNLARGLQSSGLSEDGHMAVKGCVCPAIERKLPYFGPSGNIDSLSNLCIVQCNSETVPGFEFTLFPWRLYARVDPTLSFEDDVQAHFEHYLNEWTYSMSNETQFYRNVSSIMRRLDMNTVGWKSDGNRKGLALGAILSIGLTFTAFSNMLGF